MLGKEALVILTNLSQLIATKIEEPLSQVRGWVNVRIAITVARLYSHMIRSACLTSTIQYQELEWDPGPGLVLVQ